MRRRASLLGASLLGAATLLAGAATCASALTVTGASASGAVEGTQFSGTVGSFDGDGLLFCSPGNYSASVTWSDGSSQAATVTASGASCSFAVSATHTFPEESSTDPADSRYTLSVSGPLFDQGSANGTAAVADAALTATPGARLSAVAGSPVSGTLATFSDANPAASASEFGATVNWGDGSSSPATITADAGHFDVNASHTYVAAASYAPAVTINDVGGAAASTSGAVAIASPATPNAPAASPPATTNTGSRGSTGGQVASGSDSGSLAMSQVIISKPTFVGRGAVRVQLRCPPGPGVCRGVLRLVSLPKPRAGSPRLRHGAQLSSSLFILAAGNSESIDLRLPRDLQRLIRRARGVRAQVFATTFGAAGSAASAGPVAQLRLGS